MAKNISMHQDYQQTEKLLIEKKNSIYIPTEEIAEKEYGLSAIPGTKMSKSSFVCATSYR